MARDVRRRQEKRINDRAAGAIDTAECWIVVKAVDGGVWRKHDRPECAFQGRSNEIIVVDGEHGPET